MLLQEKHEHFNPVGTLRSHIPRREDLWGIRSIGENAKLAPGSAFSKGRGKDRQAPASNGRASRDRGPKKGNIMKLKSILAALLLVGSAGAAFAAEEVSAPTIGGYDPVSYHGEGGPVRGSGMFTSVHEGQTYLFANEENKKRFDAAPAKFAPAYGGWCAYGVAVGKKFHADPTVYAIIDGRVYLNLNKDIQAKWESGRAEHLTKSEANWPKIRSRAAAKL
ncbi:MAG: YHS domain-containing protein [Myxococcales bacterium]|nr:YHS domain-containing protein [Myxococcales bacterium]